MADHTAIEWSDATWNPTTGCDRVSPGCAHCYALSLAERLKKMGQPAYQRDGDPRTSGPGFALTLHEDRLGLPLRWARPRRVFVNSMSDLFHPEVPYEYVDRVFAVMALAKQHTFQILTKRPERMRHYLTEGRDGYREAGYWVPDSWTKDKVLDAIDEIRGEAPGWRGRPADADMGFDWPLPNVWLATSVENARWRTRIDELRETPAAVRFLSCEPLLGALGKLNLEGIGWVIAGGESGPDARPVHSEWVREIRDQCITAGVPFFFKQWGAWSRGSDFRDDAMVLSRSGRLATPEAAMSTPVFRELEPRDRFLEYVRRTSKRAAGRELDGRTWDEMPAVPA